MADRRKGYLYLKEIPVNEYGKGTALKLCKAAGNGKSKSGAFCSSGPVSYTHLDVYKRQIEDGAQCLGYHYWGLIDNWSGSNAFNNRYGFIEVD